MTGTSTKTANPLALLLVLVLGAGTSFAQGYELQSPGPANQQVDGLMFDLAATEDLRITGIDVHLSPGPQIVEVWTVTSGGSHLAVIGSPQYWTRLGTVAVTGSATAVTHLPLGLDLPLEGGQPRGFYIAAQGGLAVIDVDLRQGGYLAPITSDGKLEIRSGLSVNYLFGTVQGGPGATNNSYDFVGKIHYSPDSEGEGRILTVLGNPTRLAPGIMFDISSKEPVTIEGFEVPLSSGGSNFQIYTTIDGGSLVGHTTDPTAWMLVGEDHGQGTSPPGLTRINTALDVSIPAGETRGFYLVYSNSTPASDWLETELATAVGAVADRDEVITVQTGVEIHWPFVDNGPTPIDLIGGVYYRRHLDPGYLTGSNLQLSVGSGTLPMTGCFFDITALAFIQISHISFPLAAGTHDIELYHVTGGGSHVGKTTDTSYWTLTSSAQLTTQGFFSPWVTTGLIRLVLEPGETQGFYLTSRTNNAPMQGLLFPAGATLYSGTWYDFICGETASYPFTPTGTGAVAKFDVSTAHPGSHTPISFSTDFASGNGVTPPSGWFVSVDQGNDRDNDGWRFDNPQGVVPPPPMDSDVAIIDSDHSGPGNPIDSSLISPHFDAASGTQLMSVDHWHQPLASVVHIDVWDGTSWQNAYTNSSGTSGIERLILDITAACGGHDAARVRFRYTGNWDWHWMIDNVSVASIGEGQEPRPELGTLDVEFASERNGLPVSSGAPGPYFSEGRTTQPANFRFEGEPGQPVILMQGDENVNGWDFLIYGKLDIGQYVPATGAFIQIEQLASGAEPGFINSLFFLNAGGRLDLAFPLPPFLIGQTLNFQGAIYNSFMGISLTNMVSMTVIN